MSHVSSHSSLIKTILHKSLAEGVYRDVTTRSSNYYYFLGKTLSWAEELNPPYPIDSYAYERAVRNEIITMKQIGPSDVSFVVPRRNWVTGTVYDMYDDEYCNEIIGIDIVSGGSGFNTLPTITITGGGGTGAVYTPVVLDGQIIDVDLVSKGVGYTSVPTVTVTGGGGIGAELRANLNLAYSGANTLEESTFYVMTDDFNVYKCLDNNNNAPSTVKPTGTSVSVIETSDGYVWKYLYNVPINLRNKFVDDNYIPVTSALTNQFYSNGTVDSIIINNKGSGYTTATLTVTGDGYRPEDPVFVTGVVMNSGGSSYSSPTVTFTDPVTEASLFISGSSVFLGQKIYNSVGDFYEITSPGTLSSVEPSHRYATVQNGTAALKFVGTRAKGTAVVSAGEITGINLIGSVREINLISGGAGYTTAPTITFSGGGGSSAVATAKMNASTGSVLYCVITNSGDNYSSDPTVTFGEEWTASTPVLIGEQYFVANRLYTVTAAGTTHASTAPTHTSGTATNGTATFEYVGYPATGSVVRRYGAGYLNVPTITISEVGASGAVGIVTVAKSEAKLLPILDGGQIVGVTPENPGIGYSTASIAVSGTGTGASLSADLNVGNIQSLQANNEILTLAGTINAIKLISGGYGYGVATVEIDGDGTGATATADIDTVSGRVIKINVTNPGQNYTYANITIVGNGKAAKARAIMSPYGGHGKNAPDELYARTLVFYSNVSTDLNQGLQVNNDYRQIGIIKNPRSFASNTRYSNIIGSACFLVQGSINTTYFPKDTDCSVNAVSYQIPQINVNTATEVITYTAHGLQTGNSVKYFNGGGADITGLNNGDDYYIIKISDDTFKLATTASNANSGTAINLTSTGNNSQYLRVTGILESQYRYRVVSSTSSAVLLQSLDNDIPAINDVFENNDGQTFTASSVSIPSVDKYSGQMMYIDNKAGFTPSDEETVTLRTIIKF